MMEVVRVGEEDMVREGMKYGKKEELMTEE